MARITYGPLVTEIAGSIGGITFQRNTSGPIAKLKTNPPVNPRAKQSARQQQMAFLVSFWSTLSQVNKGLWNTFAAAHDHTTPWGETKTLSGFQWFLSVNNYRMPTYDTPVSSPPAWQVLDPPEDFTITAGAEYFRANWDPPYDPVYSLQIYLSLPLRQSSLKLRRSTFLVGSRLAGDALTILDLISYFQTLTNVTWGPFFAAANCSIICRMLHSRLISGLVSSYTSAIVKIG